jgi:hypothetical protein
MVKTGKQPSNHFQGALWILATETGWIVGMGLAVLLGEVINPLTTGLLRVIGWGVLGLLVGTAIGISQSLVLRDIPPLDSTNARSRWIGATIVGWGLGLAVVIGLGAGDRMGFGISGSFVGFFTGLAQIIALPRKFQAPVWWLLASIGAWFAGLGAIDLMNQIAGFLLGGVIASSLTGAVLFGGLAGSKNGQPEA